MRGIEVTGFEVVTKLNRKDYGINWNRAMDQGALLGDDVEISINVEALKAAPQAAAPAAAPPAAPAPAVKN